MFIAKACHPPHFSARAAGTPAGPGVQPVINPCKVQRPEPQPRRSVPSANTFRHRAYLRHADIDGDVQFFYPYAAPIGQE